DQRRRQDQERAGHVRARRGERRREDGEDALAVDRVNRPADERSEDDEVARAELLEPERPETPARDHEEDAEDGDDDAEPLARRETLAEIEARAERHHDGGRRLEDDRVARGRVVDRDVRELRRAPDARDAQDDDGRPGRGATRAPTSSHSSPTRRTWGGSLRPRSVCASSPSPRPWSRAAPTTSRSRGSACPSGGAPSSANSIRPTASWTCRCVARTRAGSTATGFSRRTAARGLRTG